MAEQLNTIAVPATRVGGYSPLKALASAQENVDADRKRRQEESAEQDRAVISQVMSQHPEDPDTAIKVLKQRGFTGAAMAFQKLVTEERTKMSELRGQELENLFRTGQVSAQQVEAEHKALTRGREEDWAELHAKFPEQAIEKAPFMLGFEKWNTLLTRLNQEARDKANAANLLADNERMAAAAEVAARDREADNLRADEQLNISRGQLGVSQARLAAQKAGQISGGGASTTLSPTAESNITNRLTTQWAAAKKPAEELARAASLMNVGMQAAKRGDMAAGSQAVLVTFQKILDPTSVVRESEYERSPAGQSLMNRVRGAYERLSVGGAGIPVSELEKFKALADEAVKAQTGAFLRATKERIGRTADRYKIPREIIFEDVDVTTGATPAAGGTKMTAEDLIKKYGGK